MKRILHFMTLVSLPAPAPAPVFADNKYSIKQNDPNMTLGSDQTAGAGDGSTEYKVATYVNPSDVVLVFTPASEFQLYATDNETTPAELNSYVAWRIVHKDSTGQGVLERASGLYVNSKFTADSLSRKKLDAKFKVKPLEQLVLYVTPISAYSVKPSTCKFELTCRRIAPQLQA